MFGSNLYYFGSNISYHAGESYKKMLYRQKKDTYIRKITNGCYICTKETFKERVVDESGAVFLGAITRTPQTIDEIVDKLLKYLLELTEIQFFMTQ